METVPFEPQPLSRKIMALILLFASLSHITADMYVPSLPAITETLRTTPTVAQLTLATFLLSFGIAHLIYGPLSDRIGRRQPLLWGVGLSAIGTLSCAFAVSVPMLLFGRLIQGLGVAACNSVGRSFVRDLVSGNHLAKIGSHLGMIVVFVTATAPTLGGFIQQYFNWRPVFLLLFFYTAAIWFFGYFSLPETNQHLDNDATKPSMLLKNYWTVLHYKAFLGFTLCVSFAYAGLIAYVTSGPFLLQTVIGLTPSQYGSLAFVIGAGIFSSFFINSRLVMKIGINIMVLVGAVVMLLGGSMMLLFAKLGYLNAWVVALPAAMFALGAGLTFANASAGALQPFAKMAGTAGALFGCLQVLGGVIASTLVSKLHFNTQIPLAMIFIVAGILSLLAWKFLATAEKQVIVITHDH